MMLELHDIVIGAAPGIELELHTGESIGIRGSSGSGKTRLLRAIADLDDCPGRLLFDGKASTDMSPCEWRRRIALLPAESLWWFDTIGEHFPDVQRIEGLGFGPDVAGWQSSRCSSGEKQRLAILRMLANEPDVLLLDEPTANLDADNAAEVEKLITDYLSANEASAIWVSHDLDQLKRVAGRRFQMVAGELVKADD